MKDLRLLSLLAVVATLPGCDTLNRPISSGDFDPLVPPGNQRGVALAESSGFVPGQFVQAALDNTSFYLKKPKGDAEADRLLKAGTPMKIVAVEDSYLKVELDSGQVGYVPSILVSDPNAVPSSSSEVQVYPPLPGGTGDVGNVPTTPLPPGADPQAPANDALPAVIEPDGSAPAKPDAGAKPEEKTKEKPAGE